MRWKGREQSRNVEDRRGERMPTGRSGGGGFKLLNLLLLGFLKASPKAKLVMLMVGFIAFIFFRGPLMQIFGFSSGGSAVQTTEQGSVGQDDEMRAYLSTMMADNEKVWPSLLGPHQIEYRPCKMVIYRGRTMTAGGVADAGTGPFYSPGDETIYIDPTFFEEMKSRFGATGDFAEAYVVAHEYGHHIQKLLGRLQELHSSQGQISKKAFNRKSVRVELHADFLAGVFARHAQMTFGNFLEKGDIEEAIRAAQAIGDDRLQSQQGSGRVNPDAFTHGTSAQRARWFNKGISSGDLRVGEQLYTLPYEDL